MSMWIGITYVTQNIQYTRAKQVHDEISLRLGNNDFDPETIQECRNLASQCGYDLTIDLYEQGGEEGARIILDMTYQFPVFQNVKRYSIEGYAS